MWTPLCVTCFFSLTAWRIFYLSLILENFSILCPAVDLVQLNLPTTLWSSCTWTVVLFSRLGDFSAICALNMLFTSGILKSFWAAITQISDPVMLSWSCEFSLLLFIPLSTPHLPHGFLKNHLWAHFFFNSFFGLVHSAIDTFSCILNFA